MVSSGLVFSNGLGLEGGMESALANAEADGATVVEVAPQLDPLPFGGHDHAEEGRATRAMTTGPRTRTSGWTSPAWRGPPS